MEDKDFWVRLMLELPSVLRAPDGVALKFYWCDGFLPEFISNTKFGATISGTVWLMKDWKESVKSSFTLAVPQKLLARKVKTFELEAATFDPERKHLECTIQPST